MASLQRTIIATDQAPGAIGPYSQAITLNGLIYTSGQIALNPATGQLAAGDIQVQTRQAIENMRAVLRAAGTDLERVLKTTVFLVDMDDFTAMNEVYGQYFAAKPPARSTVAVAQLPRSARFEIECIAQVGE